MDCSRKRPKHAWLYKAQYAVAVKTFELNIYCLNVGVLSSDNNGRGKHATVTSNISMPSHYLNQYWLKSLKFESEFYNFIQENAFRNVVCQMATILSRGRWVRLPHWMLCVRQICVPHISTKWWQAMWGIHYYCNNYNLPRNLYFGSLSMHGVKKKSAHERAS